MPQVSRSSTSDKSRLLADQKVVYEVVAKAKAADGDDEGNPKFIADVVTGLQQWQQKNGDTDGTKHPEIADMIEQGQFMLMILSMEDGGDE